MLHPLITGEYGGESPLEMVLIFKTSFATQPVLMALALFFVRESPYWLASKGDKILFDNPPLDDDHQIPRRSSSNTKMMSIRKIKRGS